MKTKQEARPVDLPELRATLARVMTNASVLADRAHAAPDHPDSMRMFLELHRAAEMLRSACRLLVP